MQAGQKDTSQMITDLARLLRSNVGHQGDQKVTIAQELEYVQYYLNLQKVRFTDKLSYEIDYEDNAILQYYLPKLTIQPLVENCIVHGLENKRDGGKVEVRIWEKDEELNISVSDNGTGFDTTSLNDSQLNPSHNHVALSNIKKRIKLLYGDKGDLHVSSTPGYGTKILVVLPKDRIKG
jgi:sensor histidine kinase YesM